MTIARPARQSMQTYPMQLVAEGRLVQLLVLGSRRVAFVYVDGAPLGWIGVEAEREIVTLEPATQARLALTGLEPARFTEVVADALRVELHARRALEVAVGLAGADRDRAREWMKRAASRCAVPAEPATQMQPQLAERLRVRIEELALRFA